MLARLQQAITLALLAAAVAWGVWFRSSPAVACAGVALILGGYSIFLAVEFVAVRLTGPDRSVPVPTWWQLARAWAGETCTAPRVFCWRQPFRSWAVPDHLPPQAATSGLCGVVLIHGFVCNRGFWTPWLHALRQRGHPFVAVNLEPVFGSIDDYADVIEAAVQRVRVCTGRSPVLVCHSMGGLAARAWLRRHGGQGRAAAAGLITIGTPHGGTWLGRFSHLPNGRQMRLQSDWLTELAGCEPDGCHSLVTCWYSNCDNIVFPASTATLPGADNRLVTGVAHVALAFSDDVMRASLAKIGSL